MAKGESGGRGAARGKTGRGKKGSYHHGDLRRALIDAAWRLVRERGIEALTLREVARSVGVTHAAPYHHFESLEALLDVLSEEAFEALDHASREALSNVEDPSERLYAAGTAYIDHARAHPEHAQVMFRRQAFVHLKPDPKSAAFRAFSHLFNAVIACQEAGRAPPGNPWSLALSAWSLVHGFVKLWVEGPLESMIPYRDHFESLRDEMLRGFGAGWRAQAGALRAQESRSG